MGLFDFWKKKPAPTDPPKEAAPVEPYAIGPVPQGMRRIEVVKARTGKSAAQWHHQRMFELDGTLVRESIANNLGGQEQLFERFGTVFPTEGEARAWFDGQVGLINRNFPFITRHDRDVPLPKWKTGEVPFATHPELERAVTDAKDDAAFDVAARVLTDWLVSQGDPRAFLASPMARFVTHLRFGLENYEGDNDWGVVLRAVGESPRAAELRSLRFDDYGSEDSELSWNNYGDLQHGWAKLTGLEELVLRAGGDGALGAIELPSLKRFVRETGGLRAHELTDLTNAKWPKLEHLEIWFGEPGAYGGDCTVDQLDPLLERGVPAGVKSLALKNSSFEGALVNRVLEWPRLSSLEVLDLSMGTLGEVEAALLIASADRLRHLKRLDLRENLLGASSVEAVKAALPNAVLDDQRDPQYRYVAVGE